MYYIDKREVRLGDIVKLVSGDLGVIVCSIDSDEYSEQFTKADWSYLKHGVMIIFAKDGLVHYENADDLSFVSRKQ